MVSTLNAAGQQFLSSIDYLQTALSKAQAEVSSGLKVNVASDAPDQVSPILQLHANIQHNQQIQDNLKSVQAQVSAADQSLSTGITVLDQVATFVTNGLAASQTTDTRTILAGQVDDLLKQMISLSQTAVNGRYIFSGDSDQTASYQYNSSSATGVDRLQTSNATQQVEDPAGNTFAIGLSANQIFDASDSLGNPVAGNVFAAINSVRVALLANDSTALQTALTSVQNASKYLNQQQTFYGNVQTRVSSALDQASNADTAYRSDLSSRQDADQAAAILEMQQYTYNLQAAMASEAKMPHNSLFDLLQG
jgi:flagellar hook-associated protein 3 FlgL